MKGLCVAIAFLVLSPLIGAQSRTVAVFDLVPLTAGASPALAPAFSDSIALQLGNAGYTVLAKAVVRAAVGGTSDPRKTGLNRDEALALAKSLGADAVVIGFYGIEGRVLTAGVRAYDVLTGRLAVSAVEEGASGLGVFATIDAMAAVIVEKIRHQLPELLPQEIIVQKEKLTVQTVVVEEFVEKGISGEVTLTSPIEGAELWSGNRSLGTVVGGKAVVPVKLGAPLLVTQRAPGWYETTTTLQIPAEGGTLALPASNRRGTWEVSASMLPQAPLGLMVGGAWHLLPDTLTVDFNVGAFAVTGMPFYRADAGLMFRFFPVDSPVRMGLGLSALYYAVQPGPVLQSLGWGPVLRAEYNADRWRIFTDLKAQVPLGQLSNFYDSSFSLGSSFTGGFAWKF